MSVQLITLAHHLEDVMNNDKTRFTADRRMFLKGAAVAGGTAALAAVSATGLVDQALSARSPSVASGKSASQGYHETQHIRDYYRALRS
jgi:nitrous oxide reductase